MFWTDSGKIEFYSQKLAAQGFDPMPTWHDEEVEDPPQGYYRLLFGRSPVHTFGRTTNNRLLSEVMDENGVWVNRKIAQRWGLENGDRVYLQNQDGVRSSFSAPVKVTDRIHPDAVYMVHGYGRKAKGLKQVYGKGIDDAELVTRYKTDPIMGGTGMNVNFVTFLRAEDVDAAAEAAAEEADCRLGGRSRAWGRLMEPRLVEVEGGGRMSDVRYGMAIDTGTCVGCAACVIGCKTENDTAPEFSRDWIYTLLEGEYPNLRMTIRSERCNHCEDAPCVTVCPTGSSHYGPAARSRSIRTNAPGVRPASPPAPTMPGTSIPGAGPPTSAPSACTGWRRESPPRPARKSARPRASIRGPERSR